MRQGSRWCLPLVILVLHPTARVDADCDASGSISHGTITTGHCEAPLLKGGCCDPTCSTGYELSGQRCCKGCVSHPIDGCLEDQARCHPKPCLNANGAAPGPHGQGAGDCPPVLQNGQSCNPGCERGYEANSPRTCALGTLSGATKCVPVTCVLPAELTPPNPAHTTTTCKSSTTYTFGDTGTNSCEATCTTGWTGGQKTATFTCGWNTHFSHRDFSCKGA
jgi:hypothetical protein